MTNKLAPLAAFLSLCACGSSDGDVLYWKITSSSLAWGSSCSDQAAFRGSISAPNLANTFLTYRHSTDGKSAIAMDCTTTDPSSCKDMVPAMVFDLAGAVGTYTAPTTKSALGTSGCSLQAAQVWTFTEGSATIGGQVAITFSLVDNAAACSTYETALEAGSPNHQGAQGCVVTISFAGDRY